MAIIIMVAGGKGGIGKSTTTVNLAYELSQQKKRVLILDFDGQGDSTKCLTTQETPYYIGDVLLDRKFDITKAIQPAIINQQPQDNLHFIAARRRDIMTKLNMDMISLTRREERLSIHLKAIQNNYDYIIIDTPPGTSVLSLNAVFAATHYIFPTEYKENALDGVESLLEHIQEVKFIDEEDINFIVVPCNIDKRAKKCLVYGTQYLKERWPNNTAKTTIWKRELFTEAEMEHKPASVINSGHVAAMYYKDLAKEVLAND